MWEVGSHDNASRISIWYKNAFKTRCKVQNVTVSSFSKILKCHLQLSAKCLFLKHNSYEMLRVSCELRLFFCDIASICRNALTDFPIQTLDYLLLAFRSSNLGGTHKLR